jgi:3-hydroxyisobutyrate dehydrogenase-like beta-hydroxyacid dehydrogenase
MKAGFIGLGNMGQPMASNLLKAGHEIAVYNRTRARAEDLASKGARVATTPAEACSAGTVLTMLADDHAVEEIVFGQGGILTGFPAGGVHISHSTISTALSQRLAEAHAQRGQIYISAPVFGRPEAAQAARLLVIAAGPADAIERCRPLLEAVSRKMFVVGTNAAIANAVKLAGNFMIAAMLETYGEALALMRKVGVEPALFHEIISSNLFQSPVYESYGKIIAEQRYEPAGFKARLGLKDVRLALAAAEAAEVPLPIASLVRDHLLALVARGQGDIDWAGVAKVAAENAGLKTQSAKSSAM